MARDFYPRSPCGERPRSLMRLKSYYHISIHALLAESDPGIMARQRDAQNFYPRSPCGERPLMCHTLVLITPFLSTLSLRRATNHSVALIPHQQISIHALLAESDPFWAFRTRWDPGFLSTLSLRRATFGMLQKCPLKRFLSTLSLRRATRSCKLSPPRIWISIHALLAESDL